MTVGVAVVTTASTMGLAHPDNAPSGGNGLGSTLAFLLSSLGLIVLTSLSGFWPKRRPQRIYRPVFLFLLAVGFAMNGCGGGSPGGGAGTPVGTYNLTVTGTFTASTVTLTHIANLTLVVQ
jgi:hypothetical protein